MKKTLFLFSLATLVIMSVYSQDPNFVKSVSQNNFPGRDLDEAQCPVPSLYSQTPGIPGGFGGIQTIDNLVLYDDILVAEPIMINQVSFWMWPIQELNDPVTFDIIFRHDDGNGSPGNIYARYDDVSISGEEAGDTGYDGPFYVYTYTLPKPITVQPGDWLGIDEKPDDVALNYWALSGGGNNLLAIFSPLETQTYPDDLAFCLARVPLIPLSNWAVALGIFLIVVVVVIRFRRF